MGTPAKQPDLGPLTEISYATRDIGYGSEEGIVSAYLTDDVDTWGKRTVYVVLGDGSLETWYLFDDEYEEII